MQARTDAQNSSEVIQRQSRLGATIGDVQATFEASLKTISGLLYKLSLLTIQKGGCY